MKKQSMRLVLLTFAFLLSSCATEKSVMKSISKLQVGPKSPPTKTITNFSNGLACMDNMFLEYKKSQVSFLIENLTDNTGQVSSGTRDMLITALSSMSKRSNVIRIVAYGSDSSNAISLGQQAGVYVAHQNVPSYDIRGSISQYDSHVASNRNNIGVSTKKWGFGGSRRVSGDILGIDLSIIRTADLSVVNSATSSNQVIIMSRDSSADGDAVIKKYGVAYNFSLDRTDAPVQAVRNMFELGAIELIGRLLKVPYWHCLDIPHDSDEVIQEVSNWVKGFEQRNLLVPYLSRLLDIKGFYDTNEPDSTIAFQRGVKAYQQSIGVTQNGVVDLAFVLALFKRSDADSMKTLVTSNWANDLVQPLLVTAPSTENNATHEVNIMIKGEMLARKESTELQQKIWNFEVFADKNSYIDCYFTDLDGRILRVFPNRYQSNNYVKAGSGISFPGDTPFTLELDPDSGESINCFATESRITARLPLEFRNSGFDILSEATMGDVRNVLIKAALGPVSETTFAR